MRLLYHQPLSPACRFVRLALAEKRLDFSLSTDAPVAEDLEPTPPNRRASVPILVNEDGSKVSECTAIVEYLETTQPTPALIPGDAINQAEVRRLSAWFNNTFHREVSGPIIFERIDKRFFRLGEPDMSLIRASLEALSDHLEFIGFLAERRRWLAGDELSCADLAAAAHISCLDYVGDIPWHRFPRTQEWYVRIKSRPSFRALLADQVAGVQPPRHYANLDF